MCCTKFQVIWVKYTAFIAVFQTRTKRITLALQKLKNLLIRQVIYLVLSQHMTRSKIMLVFQIASPFLLPHEGITSSILLYLLVRS